MKTYLKDTTYGGIDFMAYNQETLSSINVFRNESINISQFDNLEDFIESLNKHINVHGYMITGKKDFDLHYINFANNLNNLIKEL